MGTKVIPRKRCAINLPVDAVTTCPSWRSSNDLREMSFDVYCHGCGWDCSSALMEAGGLDALIYEFEMDLEHQKELPKIAPRRHARKQKQEIMRCAV
jgi:hypothetical protein